MASFLMLSTALAVEPWAPSVDLTCAQTKHALAVNQAIRVKDELYEALVGSTGDSITSLMNLGQKIVTGFDPVEQMYIAFGQERLLPDRVVCQDTKGVYRPCTALYGATVCEQVALYFRDGAQSHTACADPAATTTTTTTASTTASTTTTPPSWIASLLAGLWGGSKISDLADTLSFRVDKLYQVGKIAAADHDTIRQWWRTPKTDVGAAQQTQTTLRCDMMHVKSAKSMDLYYTNPPEKKNLFCIDVERTCVWGICTPEIVCDRWSAKCPTGLAIQPAFEVATYDYAQDEWRLGTQVVASADMTCTPLPRATQEEAVKERAISVIKKMKMMPGIPAPIITLLEMGQEMLEGASFETVVANKKDDLVSDVESWAEEQKLKAKGELLRQVDKYVPGPVNMRMHFATKTRGSGIECMPNAETRYVRCWKKPGLLDMFNGEEAEEAGLTDVSEDKMTWNKAKKHCKNQGGVLPWVTQALDAKEDIWTLKRCQR